MDTSDIISQTNYMEEDIFIIFCCGLFYYGQVIISHYKRDHTSFHKDLSLSNNFMMLVKQELNYYW